MITSATVTNGQTLTSIRLPMSAEAKITERTEYPRDATDSTNWSNTGKETTPAANTTGASAIVWPGADDTEATVTDNTGGAILYDGKTRLKFNTTSNKWTSTTVYNDNGDVVKESEATKKVVTKYSVGHQ